MIAAGAAAAGADVVVHTAGPFQRATAHPWAMNVLEACIETKVIRHTQRPSLCPTLLSLPLFMPPAWPAWPRSLR